MCFFLACLHILVMINHEDGLTSHVLLTFFIYILIEEYVRCSSMFNVRC